ncbi:MAG TPA: DUF2254 domain-containing protein [Phycisphaerales bacterium]|nr:DUF2254 domain-containing protein [Phycisphaerales bacterium]
MPFKARILSAYDALRSSYWFLPSLMALGALLLSYATLWVDEHTSAAPAGWFYTGTPEGARSVLAVIAGSMISTVGLVFSIVIVALQLASSQFGPRLLRTFVRDTANQIVLGTFIAAFLYALMILRNVHGSVADSRTFVPQVSMLTAVALALGGIGVLIYFIHHTAAMIQAPNVINAVALDLHDAINRLYPMPDPDAPRDAPDASVAPEFEFDGAPLAASDAGHAGYIERIELSLVVAVAARRDLLIRIERYPGQLVLPDEAIMTARSAAPLSDEIKAELRDAYTIAPQRSLSQDAGFPLDQLLEIALRALSPGVNDPFTAIQCTQRIGDGLAHLAARDFPSPFLKDDKGVARVRASVRPLSSFIDLGLGPLRHAARESLLVLLELLHAAERIALRLGDPDALAVLSADAEQAHARAIALASTPSERDRVEAAYGAFHRARAAARPRRPLTPPSRSA